MSQNPQGGGQEMPAQFAPATPEVNDAKPGADKPTKTPTVDGLVASLSPRDRGDPGKVDGVVREAGRKTVLDKLKPKPDLIKAAFDKGEVKEESASNFAPNTRVELKKDGIAWRGINTLERYRALPIGAEFTTLDVSVTPALIIREIRFIPVQTDTAGVGYVAEKFFKKATKEKAPGENQPERNT